MSSLNLGAGNNIKGGSVNHDVVKHRPEITSVWDLNVLPWPWADNSFDRIIAISVLEHLRLNLVQSLDECWRILRPGGHIFLKLPHWQSETAHQDPTHYWFFSLHSFDQFDPDTKRGKEYMFYSTRKWRLLAPPPALNKGASSIIVRMEVRK